MVEKLNKITLEIEVNKEKKLYTRRSVWCTWSQLQMAAATAS